METEIIPRKIYNVGIENALLFVVDKEEVSLELLDGFAEIFGSELVQNTVYTFPQHSSWSLYTWKGCSVRLSGKPTRAYVSSESFMMISVNIHACLEEMRIVAGIKNRKGPISLVAGPWQSGKSSFCRLLLNYAARLGRKPIYVDLSVAKNSSLVPGVISIKPIENPCHVTDGFTRETSTIFQFGYHEPKENVPLYFLLVKKVGEVLQEQMDKANPKIRSSGVIIDTCGWVRKDGYAAITLASYVFKIDVLFVIDDEKLFLQLKKDMPSSVKVVYVPKEECVVQIEPSLQLDLQVKRIWEYFYGPIKDSWNPYKFDVNFSDMLIYTARSRSSATNAYGTRDDDVKIVRVRVSPAIVNSVLGLSFARTKYKSILITNVQCFICILKVDMDRKIVTILSRQPSPLPSKIFIMGSLKLRNIDI